MTEDQSWTRQDLPKALNEALEAALATGARMPVVLRLPQEVGMTDWVLLLSGRSDRNVRGIVEAIDERLHKQGVSPLGTDGYDQYMWALMDYDDFLVHVFYHPVRAYYDLESMWSDAPKIELGLPKEITDGTDLLELEAPDPMPEYRGDLDFGGFEDEFSDSDDDEPLDEDADEDDPVYDPTTVPVPLKVVPDPAADDDAQDQALDSDSGQASDNDEDDLFDA